MDIGLVYNVSYEVSGLIVLIVVFIHTNFSRMIKNNQNRFFLAFVWVGIFDILFDLVSTIMIANPQIYSVGLQMVFLEILYIMQLVLPYLLCQYIFSLQNEPLEYLHRKVILVSVPFAAMLILVFSNPWMKCLFSFDKDGNYTREAYYPLMYIYGIVCLVFGLVQALRIKNKAKKRYTRIIYESCIIACATVAIQMFYNDILLTGFGIALCTIILLLTLQNPNEKIDKLTKAYNMSGFTEMLEILRKKEQHIWLVTLSIDNFKRVNHVFGMENGDKVLIETTNMLKDGLPETSVFRFLGGRFAVICFSEKEYTTLCSKINCFLGKSHMIDECSYKLSACICTISDIPIKGPVNEFIAFLDYFIEETKAQGPGTYAHMSNTTIEKYKRYRQIDEYLYKAVEEDLIEVNYQPIYSYRNNCFATMEALARLTHPQLGTISPAEFIPIAEKNGLITAIDKAVLNKSCRFLSEHRELFPLMKTVKFNLSAADFMSERLGRTIAEIIAENNLDPRGIQFEITETVATQYGAELAELISMLKNLGCGICLDDFGSGYANLDSVLKLPFDAVKMDRSLLLAAVQSKRAEAFYQNIVRVLEDLEYEIIAEGAETIGQVNFLVSAGVDNIQGFYYSKPLPEQELLKLIIEKNRAVSRE